MDTLELLKLYADRICMEQMKAQAVVGTHLEHARMDLGDKLPVLLAAVRIDQSEACRLISIAQLARETNLYTPEED